MAVAFSTDSTKCLTQSVETESRRQFDSNCFDEVYEVDRCIQWIQENNHLRVALQFPDSLLHLSDKITLKIQKGLPPGSSVYILADTSYGSCCVDEVAAEHVSADSVIHFGPACLTPCNRLPVLYIFGKTTVNKNHFLEEFQKLVEDYSVNAIFLYDVTCSHVAGSLYAIMHPKFPNLVFSELQIPDGKREASKSSSLAKKNFCLSGRRAKLKEGLTIRDYSVFYIGFEGQTMTNLVMTLNSSPFYTYELDNKKARLENANVNRALRKRYYFVERAREAQIVGILMGTLGVTGYLDVVDKLKELGKHVGKKVYTIVVGRLNAEKLANFPEIDVFVLVACPENSLLDSKEFYKPVVTPFEFELACNENRQWQGEYVTDFTELMPGSHHHVPISENENSEVKTSVSLVTGKMTQLATHRDDNVGTERALLPKGNSATALSEIHRQGGGEFLTNRSWHGLQLNLGSSEAATVQDGTSGIASSYEHETGLVGRGGSKAGHTSIKEEDTLIN